MLDDWLGVPADELIVGAVHVLLMVRVVLNDALTVLVVHREPLNYLMVDVEVVNVRIFSLSKGVWIVPRRRMMLVLVGYLSVALSDLQILRLLDVHAE